MKWLEVVRRFPEANLLQSPSYGKMNELTGTKVLTDDFGGRGHAQMLVRCARRGRYLEIPCGPLLDWSDRKLVEEAFQRIRELARREHCGFVRVRPQLAKNAENLQILTDLGLKKAPMHLAAEHTVMIDLTKSTEQLLADMRRQTRYDVRRSAKQGIKVDVNRGEAIFREFHAAQVKTARRQGFIPPSLETLLAARRAFGDNIAIYTARTAENEPIAYGMIIHVGEEGDYYEAASTDLNRRLPGAYALLWQAMQGLKKAGIKRFNLWGIAPEGQPHHRYAGVTTFKTGFGGKIVEFVPAHDLVISRVRYSWDWLVETLRRKWRHLG